MAIEKIIKFSDAIQPADIINEVVDVVNNADLEEFVGASESEAGKKGIVPAPEAGSEDRYLNADGTWKEVKQNLTVYTSLEQIGITPGEETFEAIHNNLPIYSSLIYWKDSDRENGSVYPANYGIFKATKLSNNHTTFEFVEYVAYLNESQDNSTSDNTCMYYSTLYNAGFPNRICVWNKHLSENEKETQYLESKISMKAPTSNWAQFVFRSASDYYRALEGDDSRIRLDVRDTNDTKNRRYLDVYSITGKSDIRDSIAIIEQKNSDTGNYYRIYGAHNKATQALAEAGTDDNSPMTPLRVKQAIAANNAKTATTLQTARTIRTNLASTSTASFNGSANITPGVTGVLPIANGGTGASTVSAARTNLGIFNSSGHLTLPNGAEIWVE